MPPLLRSRRRLALVIAVALAARLAAQVALGMFTSPEVWEEGVIAENIAAGRGYSYEWLGSVHSAFRASTYPILLAIAYLVLGVSPWVAAVLNALLGAGTAVIAYGLGRRLGGTQAGLLAGLLVALHPGLLVYATKVHQLSLDAFLMSAAVALAVVAPDRLRAGTAVAFAATAGALALSRPTAIPFIGIASAAVVTSAPSVIRRRAAIWSTIALAGTLLVVGAWVARNWIVVGTPTLTTTTGVTLWIGNNPNASGSTMTFDGRPMLETDPDLRSRVQGLGEVEQDRVFREEALRYALSDPARTVRAVAAKFATFWWFGPAAGVLYPREWLTAYALYYAGVLALAAVGAWRLYRGPHAWPTAVIATALVSVALAQSLFYVDGRHRWAIEPLLLVVAAVGAATVVSVLRARLSRRAELRSNRRGA